MSRPDLHLAADEARGGTLSPPVTQRRMLRPVFKGKSKKPTRTVVTAPHKHRLPRRPAWTFRDEAPPAKTWLIILVLLSLFTHALLMFMFLYTAKHAPKWKELQKDEPPPEVMLSLAPPPRQPQKPDFIPTDPQQGATPPETPLISDNDNNLKSQNQKARAPDSVMPDVSGHKDHSLDLHSRPQAPKLTAQTPTPPTPQKQQPQKTQPRKNQAKPNDAIKPAPPDPSAIKPTDNPEQGKVQDASKEKPPDQQFDPNGLPVLPPINAPTIAPQTPQTQPVPQIPRQASPQSAPSFAVYQSDVSGQVGQPGDNSPAARATDLGRYKAKVYRAVGSRWYEGVNKQIQLLGVGTVHITYTIYSDGHMVITADPDGSNPALMLLHSISVNAMNNAAPFDPFSDKMKKEIGDSYSDDFSFSIYGD